MIFPPGCRQKAGLCHSCHPSGFSVQKSMGKNFSNHFSPCPFSLCHPQGVSQLHLPCPGSCSRSWGLQSSQGCWVGLGDFSWAGRFKLWGRISPLKVLSRKHLVFPLHESGCHLSLPAARANFNGCSPSQGQRERAGTLSGVTAALRALWVLPIHRAHTGRQLCFLLHTESPSLVCAAMRRFLDTFLLIRAVQES